MSLVNICTRNPTQTNPLTQLAHRPSLKPAELLHSSLAPTSRKVYSKVCELISIYLSALGHPHRLTGLPDPTTNFAAWTMLETVGNDSVSLPRCSPVTRQISRMPSWLYLIIFLLGKPHSTRPSSVLPFICLHQLGLRVREQNPTDVAFISVCQMTK